MSELWSSGQFRWYMFSQNPNYTTAPIFKIGILAIGSLYWDPKKDPAKPESEGIREAWWRTRLEKQNAILVHVPIRYGRLSSGRADTYTMVFFAGPSQLGSARVIPCQKPIASCSDLTEEAKYLWAAEQAQTKPEDNVSAEWGGVALLVKEQSDSARQSRVSDLREFWTRFIRESSHNALNYDELARSCACVSCDGLLEIPWPVSVDGSSLEFDLLLATANRPTLSGNAPTYPDAATVAAAWLRAANDQGSIENYQDYFWENRANGITTFHDEEIEAALKNSQ